MMLTLYYRSFACSLAARIALLDAGIEARYVAVDLNTRVTEQGDDFRAVNLKGKVPALICEDGSVLTENIAVLHYIAACDSGGHLAPEAGCRNHFVQLEWLSFIATELHKQCLSPYFMSGGTEADRECARTRIVDVLKILEARLQGREYLVAEHFSIADAYLIWGLLLARRVSQDMHKKSPAATGYLARVSLRPAVQKALMVEAASMQSDPVVPVSVRSI
jgi:glutathione S-transferase